MRILGIDPALSITGYGVIDTSASPIRLNKNKIILLEAGVIKTQSSQPVQERLEKIYNGVVDLIKDVLPQVMVLEKLFVHYRHPTTAYLLGQARGVICLASAQAKIPLVEYSATRVKKAIVGQGLASKQQVQRMVADLLKFSRLPKYLDVTDALALAIAHSNIMKFKI